MTAYACGSGGVMFVPEKIDRKMTKVVMKRSNDNKGDVVNGANGVGGASKNAAPLSEDHDAIES